MINKQELKKYVEEQSKIACEYFSKKTERRIITICRASINRLSYELKYDNGKIYLIREDRERIIECKSKNINLSSGVFKTVQKLLNEAKEKFI